MPVPAETTGPTTEPKVSPLDNLIDYTLKYEEKHGIRGATEPPSPEPTPEPPPAPPASERPLTTAESAAAAAAVTEPEEVDDGAPDWWESGLDVKHGFLRGKKGDEVEKAFREAQKKIRESGEAKNRVEAQLRELEAERAAWRVNQQTAAAAQAPPPKETGEDPRMQQVRDLWWADADKARELHEQIILDKAAKLVDERFTQQAAQSEAREFGRHAYDAANTAAETLAKARNITAAEARAMIQSAVHLIGDHVAQTGDRAVMLNAENYLIAYEAKYGIQVPRQAASAAPVAEAVPPPPQEQADPPGSGGAAPPPKRNAATTAADLSLAAERRKIAEQLGMSKAAADKFVQKARK